MVECFLPRQLRSTSVRVGTMNECVAVFLHDNEQTTVSVDGVVGVVGVFIELVSQSSLGFPQHTVKHSVQRGTN